jgi:tetratricopeptide (TPR) repeat protein/tRNA A-37 threonylcarbamoyl transferase component Bud32
MTGELSVRTEPRPASGPAAPTHGAQIGRFVVKRALGAGGMGVVLLAHDPALERKVALKLLRPELASAAGQARLLREAQAMARLAHPNVVTVYEVGRSGEQVFIAMELVEGSTLRSWLRAEIRPWREVLAHFVAAGQGLCAAHGAGLVHRDFKPENVLLGDDGRVRITDFGLVAGGIAIEPAAISSDSLTTAVAVGGAVAGTPAYMSAEQWAGESLDARTDQFAFCVSLWEALYGVRPFFGAEATAIAERVRCGAIGPVTPDRMVPGWIEPILRRGLEPERARRWPSLAAMLEALDRRRARRERAPWIATIGLAGLASIAATLARKPAATDPCPAPDVRIAAVFGADRREAISAHLASVDPSLDSRRIAMVSGSIERGLGAFRTGHVEACVATRVEGRQSEARLDERMACLDRWLSESAQVVAALERAADRRSIDEAIVRVAQLGIPAACAEVEGIPPPPTPEKQAEARAIAAAMDVVWDDMLAGRHETLRERSLALVERARRLDHPPTLAAALHAAVQLIRKVEAPDERLVEELTRVAAIAGNDNAAAYGWVMLMRVRAMDQQQPERGDALFGSADAAVLRAGDPPSLRFELLVTRANVLRDTARPEEALAMMERAGAFIEKQDPTRFTADPIDYQARLAFGRALILDNLGRIEESLAASREALALKERQFGPEHPDMGKALFNLGETLRTSGRLDESSAAFARAAQIFEARLGPSSLLALSLDRLGVVARMRGDAAQALDLAQRAWEMGDAAFAPGHPRRALLHTDLGAALAASGKPEQALVEHRLAIEAEERARRKSDNLLLAHAQRGETYLLLGRRDEARADLGRALLIIDEIGTADRERPRALAAMARTLMFDAAVDGARRRRGRG